MDDGPFLAIDRPVEAMVITAAFSKAIPIDGTRFEFFGSTRRVGGHSKDTHIVGLDSDGNKSFHVIFSATSLPEKEGLPLGAETGGGELIWDYETSEGEDSLGDFPFFNGSNQTGVGQIILDMLADGYVMTVNKRNNFIYKTELLTYNSDAAIISLVEFWLNGGVAGISAGFFRDDVFASHSEGISAPGLFNERTLDLGTLAAKPPVAIIITS